MPDRQVFRLIVAGLDGSHYHLAGIGSHPDRNRRLAFDSQAIRITTKILLRPKRSIERALRMVFVRDGRAEQGEDAVSGRLRSVASLAIDRIHHQPEGRINDGARLFGVEVLDQLHRGLDVGKQRRDRLALAISVWRTLIG